MGQGPQKSQPQIQHQQNYTQPLTGQVYQPQSQSQSQGNPQAGQVYQLQTQPQIQGQTQAGQLYSSQVYQQQAQYQPQLQAQYQPLYQVQSQLQPQYQSQSQLQAQHYHQQQQPQVTCQYPPVQNVQQCNTSCEATEYCQNPISSTAPLASAQYGLPANAAYSSVAAGQQVQTQPQRVLVEEVMMVEEICPICRMGEIRLTFTPCGICLAIVLFPFGIIFCFCLREQRCDVCGAVFD